jgi:carbohydrate-selective porin OprB
MSTHNTLTSPATKKRWLGLFLIVLSTISVAFSADFERGLFSDWRTQTNGITSGWFGLAEPMKSYGFSVNGEYKQQYFGQVSGGLPNQPASSWVGEVKMKFLYDFAPIFGLNGLTLESNWRDRFGGTPQYTAGTYNIFNPSQLTSGTGVRILTQQLEYTTANKAITINAGWENPYEQFLQQPLSKLFENNAIASAKGIGGTPGPGVGVVNNASAYGTNGLPSKGSLTYYKTSPVPWGSTYAAWGGTLKLKPVKNIYLQSGLYLAISGTGGTSSSQFTPTSVYPYTSVPASYLGTLRQSGQIAPVVGGNGQLIRGASQNLGWVPSYQNNHGFNFQGSPAFNPSTANIGRRPTGPGGKTIYSIPNGTPTGASTYVNSQGQKVTTPGYYTSSPYDPGNNGNYSQNGLYNVNEIGWEPKFGKSQLEGKYAIGSYIWGQENTSYTPTAFTQSVFPKNYTVTTGYNYNSTTHKYTTPIKTAYPGNYKTPTYTSYAATKPAAFEENQVVWGLYLQADQQLFREKSDDPAKLSKQGLYTFNEFTFTPPQNNQLPFYFQSGLVYRGLIPHRDEDSFGIALGAGFYSSYYNQYIQSQNQQLENAYGSAYNATVPNGPTVEQTVNPGTGTTNGITTAKLNKSKTQVTYVTTPQNYQNYYAYLPNFSSTEVIEGFYNVQLTKWASLKPGVQYIINPAGNGTIGNEWILQVVAKVTF